MEKGQLRISGRVWKFGDDIDTDQMAPWATITEPWEERKKTMLRSHPEFMQHVRPGDVIVAGRNWGCGSSREQAPENLKELGIAAVVAESFGRIYFRNCIAIAFVNLACPGITTLCEQGDELEIDVKKALVTNRTRGGELRAEPFTDQMLSILEQGGLMAVLEKKIAAGELR